MPCCYWRVLNVAPKDIYFENTKLKQLFPSSRREKLGL